MEASNDLIAIATFDTVAEAAVVQALLEADDILVHPSNSGLVGLDWSFSQAVGGVRLLVPASRAAEAIALVHAYRAGELDTADEQGTPPLAEACPRCGSRAITEHAPATSKWLLVALWLFPGALFPVRTTLRTCDDCRHRWTIDPD